MKLHRDQVLSEVNCKMHFQLFSGRPILVLGLGCIVFHLRRHLVAFTCKFKYYQVISQCFYPSVPVTACSLRTQLFITVFTYCGMLFMMAATNLNSELESQIGNQSLVCKM